MLNPLLLVASICITIASLAYLFFWNRFLGYLIGLILRVSWWSSGSGSIWIDIGSIHFSILSGRILLKDLTYHSSNQTIKILKAQISWRYWIRRPTTDEDLIRARFSSEEQQSNNSHLCRIKLSIQGFEWFLYNRTAAYENIISQMNSAASFPGFRVASTEPRQATKIYSLYRSMSILENFKAPPSVLRALDWIKKQLPMLDPKALLPIGFQISRGVIICGNVSTSELLVSEFQSADGTYGLVQSRSKHDLYKQVLGFKFQNALIHYAKNEDRLIPMTETGQQIHERLVRSKYSESRWLSFTAFAKLWRSLKLYSLNPQRRNNRFAYSKHDRSKNTLRNHRSTSRRSVDDDSPIGEASATFEYAIERKVLEAPLLELSYYADVVGEVPPPHDQTKLGGLDDIGNGDFPPEWGVDLIIRGGFIHYGPWADRQRAELQRAFFPPTYHHVEPTSHLEPGDKRVWTSLKIFIELRDDTVLHIPFREASKNWQWDGKVKIPNRPRKREAAAIHITAGDSSTISYVVPMIATASGYDSRLEVHLDDISVTSSLNDIRLITAESCRVRGELPSPLKWNSERQWTFGVSLRQPIIYILRDHINMFTDLAKDWTSGSPNDYQRFIPMNYVFELEIYHFEMNLYVNDHNIIDKPLVKDENSILTLRGGNLRHRADIPSNVFRPYVTTIPFTAEAPDVTILLSLPRWNTHSSLTTRKNGSPIGKIGLLCLKGSYCYHSEVREGNLEQLKLNFSVRNAAYIAVGWSIRHFMVLRDNYFGSFTHFSTLSEYIERRKKKLPIGDPILLKYREGSSNALHTEVDVDVQDAMVMQPAGIPGYERRNFGQDPDEEGLSVGACVMWAVPGLQVQLRVHDYAMEMSINVDTMTGCVEKDCSEKLFFGSPGFRCTKETFAIDGIDVTANRLFGPQPNVSTYFCVWEVHLGDIKSVLSAWEGRILVSAINSFRLGFSDSLNAPAAEYMLPIDPDITFLQLSLESVQTTCLTDSTAVDFSLPAGLSLASNDLAGASHRKVTSLRLPKACLRMLLLLQKVWLEVAEIIVDANVDIYSSPKGWRQSAQAQGEFIEAQDASTRRVKQMFDVLSKTSYSKRSSLHMNGLYLPQPRVSDPVIPQQIVAPRTKRANKQSRPHASSRFSRPSRSSDSEGETRVSEADRDARIARTRSATPVVSNLRNDYEQNLTSGDESDDGDLTEADSGSVWSKSELYGQENFVPPSLLQYYRWTRHFTVYSLMDPTLWHGSPFTLARDNRPLRFRTQQRRRNTESKQIAPMPPSISCVSNDGLDTTVYRFRSSKGLDISLVPLVLIVASRIEEDLEMNVFSPELFVDSVITRYLKQIDEQDPGGRKITIEGSLSSVHLQILQRVPVTDEEGIFIPRPFGDKLHGHRILTMLLDIGSHGWTVTADITRQALGVSHTIISAASQDTSISLSPIANEESRATGHKVLAFSLDEFQGYFKPGGSGIAIGSTSLEIEHTGPEYVALLASSLAQELKEIARIQEKWQAYASSSSQATFLQILKVSHGKSIIDPLSTIQPSYLVQSGRPHNLRTDSTFRFLIYLRICLWHSNHAERLVFHSPSVGLGRLDELEELVISTLAGLSLDADASTTVPSSIMEFLFPALGKSSQEHDQVTNRSQTAIFTSLVIRKLTITIFGSSSVSRGELILTGLSAMARIHTLQLIQHTSLNPSFSQTSLKDRGQRCIHRVTASISAEEFSLNILPHLMSFAQQILRVWRHHNGEHTNDAISAQSHNKIPGNIWDITYADLTLSLQHLYLRAAAENLAFEFGTSKLGVVSVLCLRAPSDVSMNNTILFDELFLRARSTAETSQEGSLGILASIVFARGNYNVVLRQENPANTTLRIMCSLQGLRLDVPRSAIRLYRFIEEWRADFLPGIEATLKEFLSELRKKPTKSSLTQSGSISNKAVVFQFNGEITSLRIALQVMHGTWVSWEVRRTILYLKSSSTTPRRMMHQFGLQIGSQKFTIATRSSESFEDSPNTRVQVVLPTLSVAGDYDGIRINTLASVDFFHFMVKPSHWDTLLSVQQKFGQDFNDLLFLVGDTRQKRNNSGTKPHPSFGAIQFSSHLKMKGFRLGLEGLSSILYLDCDDIRGAALDHETGFNSNLKFSNLALSLASRATAGNRDAFNRNHRSAFVILDIVVGGRTGNAPISNNKSVEIEVTKIHAVMQPSSIGELGDFLDHLQAEMLERKEQRAQQLKAFKEKTAKIMKTFEVKVADEPSQEDISWISEYTINVTVKNIGVAFPLAFDQGIELPRAGSGDSTAVRAFLLSVQSIVFGAQKGESGQVTIDNFSAQFISQFKQSSPSDFAGETHQTRNRLIYPQMTAQLRTERSATSRLFRIGANVSGFLLNIDSAIPDYIFSLVDVYRQGTERVSRLAASIPTDSPDSELYEIEQTKYRSVPTSSIFASLTFLSGKVRLYSGTASRLSRSRSISGSVNEPTDEQFLEFGAEIFRLPVVSVWVEYRAVSAAQKLDATEQPKSSVLVFKSTVHSSQNTLRPTLLPFLTEIVHHVETRLRKTTRNQPPSATYSSASDTAPIHRAVRHPPQATSAIQISFCLRIDQSKLELTCQPDVNVVAGLHWDSGGFIVNIAPGARQVTFTGTVGGLTAGLRHGFLTDDCVTLNATNLTFSTNFTKREFDGGKAVSSVSIVLDTQFSGGVRFSRLQDLLCFKAVWLDRIPVFNAQGDTILKTPSKSVIHLPNTVSPAKQEFTVALLVRIRVMQLEVDLGQSISTVTLDFQDILLRTKLTEALYEVSLSVADVAIHAKGNISGYVVVPDCVFQTIRKREGSPLDGQGTPKMLELSMTSGALGIELLSDHQKILQYRAEPLQIEIFDDWSMAKSSDSNSGHSLRLAFTISGTEIEAAATVGTIPKLLLYANKFRNNLDAQREGASRESSAFRVTRTPKPDNPLSAVANAMIDSARNRFKDADLGLSYAIRQHMSLRLDILRLIVFPRTMADVEVAQFTGRDVQASLDRLVESDELPAQRELHLAFSSIAISKYTQLNHISATQAPDNKAKLELLLRGAPEANIVGLPSMDMRMHSKETVDGLSKIVDYDFWSKFVGRKGGREKEDIYITLNMALYSWLTVLKRNLTREMDQALAASDWRPSSTSMSPPTSPQRKKVPEPLHIPEVRSAESFQLKSAPPPVGQSKSASPTIAPAAKGPVDSPILSSPSKSTPVTIEWKPPVQGIGSDGGAFPLPPSTNAPGIRKSGIVYQPHTRHIERLTMRQLGEATPDVMHPFFMKKAGFNLEDSLPQYVHQYASVPLEEILEALLSLYSRQLLKNEKEIANS